MPYPSKTDYHNAIKHPSIVFKNLDSQLEQGHAIKSSNGQSLWIASGQFACVFQFETSSPKKFWAVRCPTENIANVAQHYKKVTRCLQSIIYSSEYFLQFEYLDPGILVNGNKYPIIKMEWSKGVNLDKFIEKNLNDQTKLKQLAQSWFELSENLLKDRIAHGDLQHGNILVIDQNLPEIKLVDYDSLYYEPEDGINTPDQIKGVNGYQHPLRDNIQNKSVNVDFFSHLIIYLSIVTLSEKPQLWQQYKCSNSERLLFQRTDFEKPDQAQIFTDLAQLSSDTARLAEKVKEICKIKNFYQIPSLNNVLKSINHPNAINSNTDATAYFIGRAKQSASYNSHSNQPSPTPTVQSQGQTWFTKQQDKAVTPTSANQANPFASSPQLFDQQLFDQLYSQIQQLKREKKILQNDYQQKLQQHPDYQQKLQQHRAWINILLMISIILGGFCINQNQEIRELKEKFGTLHS